MRKWDCKEGKWRRTHNYLGYTEHAQIFPDEQMRPHCKKINQWLDERHIRCFPRAREHLDSCESWLQECRNASPRTAPLIDTPDAMEIRNNAAWLSALRMGIADLDILCHTNGAERREQRRADATNPKSTNPLDASMETEITCLISSYEDGITKGEVINIKFTEFMGTSRKWARDRGNSIEQVIREAIKQWTWTTPKEVKANSQILITSDSVLDLQRYPAPRDATTGQVIGAARLFQKNFQQVENARDGKWKSYLTTVCGGATLFHFLDHIMHVIANDPICKGDPAKATHLVFMMLITLNDTTKDGAKKKGADPICCTPASDQGKEIMVAAEATGKAFSQVPHLYVMGPGDGVRNWGYKITSDDRDSWSDMADPMMEAIGKSTHAVYKCQKPCSEMTKANHFHFNDTQPNMDMLHRVQESIFTLGNLLMQLMLATRQLMQNEADIAAERLKEGDGNVTKK